MPGQETIYQIVPFEEIDWSHPPLELNLEKKVYTRKEEKKEDWSCEVCSIGGGTYLIGNSSFSELLEIIKDILKDRSFAEGIVTADGLNKEEKDNLIKTLALKKVALISKGYQLYKKECPGRDFPDIPF